MDEIKTWWDGLDDNQRRAFLDADPQNVGGEVVGLIGATRAPASVYASQWEGQAMSSWQMSNHLREFLDERRDEIE